MLEQAALLLGAPEPSGRRVITTVDGGKVLGFACWRLRGKGWWRWLQRAVLEIHEQDDEPLLFTLSRCLTLLPWFEVRDADEHRVGRLLGPLIQDHNECRCAIRQDESAATASVFANPDGGCLARLSRDGEGLRLCFDRSVEQEPFVKMLLLASALLL